MLLQALNEDLAEYLKPHLRYDLATTVDEVRQQIIIKGSFKEEVKQFLEEKGFWIVIDLIADFNKIL